MEAPQEWRRVNPPPFQRKTGELEGDAGSAFAAYEDSGRMPEVMFGQHKSTSSSRQQPRRHRRRGAPGLLACSRSSDEIQRTTNVALSPVTGPGATSFSSVASAFDFQHHIGSDPASELLVLKQILTRECLLSRLEAVCGQLRKRFQLLPAASTATSDSATAGLGEGSEDIVDLLSKMRAATVAVIEAISVWRKDMTGHPPSAFVWHGDNYLLKITNDLNFLAGVQPLVNTLKMHPARFCRNPLMLPQTLDEQRRDGELHEENGDDNNVSPGAERRRHLYQAAQVLLDEESLESERDFLRQESTKSTGALPTRGETSPELGGRYGLGAGGTGHGVRSCSTLPRGAPQDVDGRPSSYSSGHSARGTVQTEDDDALRRHQGLSTWYEEARSQLVSLSTSPADEEYFLRSRRFWSKEELGDTGGICSPPAPHRRQPGTLTRGGKRSAFTAGVAATGREAIDGAQIGGTERLSDGEGSDRADLYNERASNRTQRGLPPPRRTRRSRGPSRPDGQGTRTTGGSAGQTQGGDGERGGADVWSRPDRFGGGNSAALSCLTVDDIEQVLREVDPLPATVAVCAAVVFLLSPEDQPPANFLWPQGFEAVALPVEDFLWRLHEASGGTASSTKAQFLVPVLQREYLIPEVIERQGAHAVASLCAWALEELQVCEEFAEWSEAALEPWYETQLVPTQPDAAPESNEVVGCEVRLVYKALHMLPHVGASYVISLFEDKSGGGGGGSGGFIVRAFDRAKRDAFWLSLTRNKIASFGENATRSPATLASTLARRLKLKLDGGTGKARLVLPPAKKVESSSEKKAKNAASAGVVSSSDDVGGQAAAREGVDAGTTPPASPSLQVNEPASTAVSECPAAQEEPRQRRRSHPPPMRGSKVEDLGPLVENEGDVSDCSAGELRDNRSVQSTGDGKDSAVLADRRVVEQSGNGAASEEAPHARTQVKTEQAATASEPTSERQEQQVSQTTEDPGPAQALSETLSEPPATTTNCEIKEEGLPEAGVEEIGSYAEDFTPDDDDDDKGAGRGREVEARVQETGPYADDFVGSDDRPADARVQESDSYAEDFADDGDEPYEQDGNEEERGDTQQGVENQEAADPSAVSSGVDMATGSAEAPTTTGSADAPVSEPAVEGLGGVGRRSEESPQDAHTFKAAAAQEGPSTEPQQLRGEGDSANEVDSTAERSAEAELEDCYEDEFLEESVEHGNGAEVEGPESTQPVVTAETNESSPPPADDASAEDGGASTSRALHSQEDVDSAREAADPAQQIQPEDDGCQRSSGETADDLTGTDDTAVADESDGRGKVDTEPIADVVGHELGNDSQAQDHENVVQVPPLQPMPTLIVVDALGNTRSTSAHVVDALGNTRSASAHVGSAQQENVEASTASKLAASRLASAAVAAAMESALGLVSERDEGGFTGGEVHDAPDTEAVEAERNGEEEEFRAEAAATEATAQNDRSPDTEVAEAERIGEEEEYIAEVAATETTAQKVPSPGTKVAEAEPIGEEKEYCTEVAATEATAQNNPSPDTEQGRPVEERAPLTDGTPDECFEGSFEDDTDEIDAPKSLGDGTTVDCCSDFSSFVGDTDVSPALSEQDASEGPRPGGAGGDQAEAGGEVIEPASTSEKVVRESSAAEYEDFEEDFDEEFEEDVEEETPSDRPKVGVDSGVAHCEVLSGSEGVDATTAAAGGEEEPVEVPPVEEVIGNQDEDRKGIEGRRNSVDVDQVAPVAGPPEDEVEDEFEEEDFEDP